MKTLSIILSMSLVVAVNAFSLKETIKWDLSEKIPQTLEVQIEPNLIEDIEDESSPNCEQFGSLTQSCP